MVLVKVVQLIVNVNWPIDSRFDWVERDFAHLVFLEVLFALGKIIISFVKLMDLVAHHLQHNSDGQENYAEHTES